MAWSSIGFSFNRQHKFAQPSSFDPSLYEDQVLPAPSNPLYRTYVHFLFIQDMNTGDLAPPGLMSALTNPSIISRRHVAPSQLHKSPCFPQESHGQISLG